MILIVYFVAAMAGITGYAVGMTLACDAFCSWIERHDNEQGRDTQALGTGAVQVAT